MTLKTSPAATRILAKRHATMNTNDTDRLDKLVSLTYLVYILQALGFFTAITGIAAIIVNYIKLEDTQGTWLESHFRWQIRTFWFGLLWMSVGVMSLFILFIGYLIIIANAIWILYRIIKGAIYLNDKKAMPISSNNSTAS